jgi:nucleotide-binding universal stress UspA family protein
MYEIARRHRIVVGVDGSANSVIGLRWALEEAQRLGHAAISAVYAGGDADPATTTFAHDARWRAAGKVLHAAVAAAVGEGCEVRVTETLAEGSPAPVLLSYAAQADLLVLGGRTDPGMPVRNGTTRSCELRSPCPIVIVSSVTESSTPAAVSILTPSGSRWALTASA